MKNKYGITMRARLLLSAAVLAAPAAITPAFGQMADEATVDSNTIVVTAQRRAEALEDVPMSVSVVTPETLSSLGVNTLRDLQNVTSGFSLNNSGSYPQPAIRGVTTTNSGSYENNVALWVDGLYQITPQILNMELPNVQSIQILKGPQGALYGRNATGGAILIDTIDPGSEFEGNVEATYGRFEDRRVRGYVAGPISDRIGFSLSGTYRKTDGYYKKVSPTDPTRTDGRGLGLDQQSVRAKIKADLTDALRVTIGYNFTRASDPRGVFFTPNENLTAGFPARNLGEFAGQAFELDLKQHEGLLKLEIDTAIGTLRSVTGYQYSDLVTLYDSTGRYTPSSISDSRIFNDTWQENLDLTIDAIENLDLIVGGTYFHNEERYGEGRANTTLVAPPGAVIGTPPSAYLLSNQRDSDRTKEAWALFVDATFQATDRLSINVGGRYSKETQNVHSTQFNYCTVAAGCAGGVALGAPFLPAVYDARERSSYSKFTPRVSVRYEIAPRTNIYATYSQGFKAGEWNGVIPFDNPATWNETGEIGQETVDAFEVGLKSANGNLRFDLAGFYYKYKDIQVSSVQFDPTTFRAGVLLQNLPNARIYGAETNIEYDVTPDFVVRAGATWLNARYGDDAFYRGVGVNPAGAVAVPDSDPLKAFPNLFIPPLWQDLTGMQMTRAPDFSGYVGFEYNIRNGDGGLRLAANVKYTSRYVVTDPSIWGGETDASYQARLALDPNATPNNQQVFTAAGAAGQPFLDRAEEQRATQGAYALVNASVTWTDPTDTYYIRVWGNNLTNETYAVHYRPSSRTYIPIGEPLTYGATVGVRF